MPLRRTIGGYVTANPVAPAGPYQDGAADGVWTLTEQLEYVTAGKWPIAGNVRPQYLAVAHFTSPYVTAYPWSASGFGAKYANPATSPTGTGYSVAFSPTGDAIAVAHETSPYITAYPWSASGFGTKYANPGTLPTGIGGGVAFSPTGDAIAVAHSNSPYVTAYPWSGSGFGAKYTNLATLPTGTGYGVAFGAA